MRFLGKDFKIPFFKNAASTTLASPDEWLINALIGRMAASGVVVSPLRALGVSTVYACVNAVAKSIATLPVCVYEYIEGGSQPVPGHPYNDLLMSQPNDEMTGSNLRRAVQANATLRQSGYALIVRNGLGEVVELYPIPPCDIQVTRPVFNGPLRFQVQGRDVPLESLLVIHGLTFDGVVGVSSLAVARDLIGLAISLQDNASTFFGNGSRPGGVLEHPASLTDEAQQRLRKQIEDKLKGADKAHSLLILEEGLKYVAQRTDNSDSQFLESRTYQDKAIARHFGIPQSKVGILDDAHYNNVEQENIGYVVDCLQPWVTEWEQQLNLKLFTREDRKRYFFKFNLSVLTRGDAKTRYAAYGSARQWGWLCVDEIRELEGLNPLPNGAGKIYLQPVNMQDAELEPVDQNGLTKPAKK